MRIRAALGLVVVVVTGCVGAEGIPVDGAGPDAGVHERGRAFLEAASRENGAVTLPSGVVFRTVRAGSGESPDATDRVRVRYTGRLADGKIFDSTSSRGEDATFPLRAVIPCWTEGMQRMRVGETALLTCPSQTAYGERRMGDSIPAGSVLQFEVELLDVLRAAAPAVE